MAESKIGIEYESDGADKAASDAKKVKGSLEEVRDVTDESSESTRQAADSAKKMEDSIGGIEAATKALVAVRLIDFLRDGIKDLEKFVDEGAALDDGLGQAFRNLKPAIETADVALGGMGTALTAAVATGNPVIGMLAGLTSMLGSATQAFIDMRRAQSDASRVGADYAKTLEFLEQAQRQFVELLKTDSIGEQFLRDAEDTELAMSRIRNAMAENKALRRAEAAEREAAGQGRGTIEGEIADLQAKKAAEDELIEAHRVKLENMRQESFTLQRALVDAQKYGEGSAQYIKAETELRKKNFEIKLAEEKLETDKRTRESNLRAEVAGTSQRLRGLASDEGQSISSQLGGILSQGQAGDDVSAGFARARLSEILSDATPDEQQTAEIRDQLIRLRNGSREQSAAYREGLNQAIDSMELAAARIGEIFQRLATVEELLRNPR